MTEQTQPQQVTAAPPPMEMDAAASLPLEQERSQAAPFLSFDDDPLFEAGPNEVPDDYFSSPEWNTLTDPSPALTTSMSFYNSSCDTSPLLTDNYEATADYSALPLFGDFNSKALYSTESRSNSPPSASPKRSPQMAFSRAKETVNNDEAALLLLRALNKHSNVNLNGQDEPTHQKPALTASPSVISTPLTTSLDLSRPPLFNSLSSSSLLSVQDKRTEHSMSSLRGTKRRKDVSDLLPMDAPIQQRTYKTPSATSRKESAESSFAADEAAIAAEKDPMIAKRLSNTLAARRSRHRKAEERQAMLDEIEEEKAEKEMWKKRCIRAEEELDRARTRGFS